MPLDIDAAREECCKAIRAACVACGGTGQGGHAPAPLVTREMAIDAGDPSLEGSPSGPDDVHECEYCGRPIAAIRAMGPSTLPQALTELAQARAAVVRLAGAVRKASDDIATEAAGAINDPKCPWVDVDRAVIIGERLTAALTDPAVAAIVGGAG